MQDQVLEFDPTSYFSPISLQLHTSQNFERDATRNPNRVYIVKLGRHYLTFLQRGGYNGLQAYIAYLKIFATKSCDKRLDN